MSKNIRTIRRSKPRQGRTLTFSSFLPAKESPRGKELDFLQFFDKAAAYQSDWYQDLVNETRKVIRERTVSFTSVYPLDYVSMEFKIDEPTPHERRLKWPIQEDTDG